MVYRFNFIGFFVCLVQTTGYVLLGFFSPFLIDWPEDRLSRDVSLILLITFQIVTSCFFIGFVKLEAIKILVWCVLGK